MPIFLLLAALSLSAQTSESFSYQVEWRLINAGRTDMTWDRGPGGYKAQLKLFSAGLVSRLFKVNDIYDVQGTTDLCAQNARLQAEEGSRKRDTVIRWTDRKSHYLERDLLKNETILEKDLDTTGCVHDVLAGLAKLRTLKDLQPGQRVILPISDGKKLAQARIEAQEREKISTKAGTFHTIRYEAFLFNDILFKRNARLFIWISDDARRLPVQIQVRMRIHIGTVTFTLDKVEPPTEAMKK
ncbi:MAG: DUF3108 domain-containing protein [Acidobacteria bacterium]|nr:DUF3108 domain-containing protein [Acidobacteriota bacterium]